MGFLGGFGPTELIIILVIILLVFGVGRLPEVGGAIGKGIREFRKTATGADDAPKQVESKQVESKTETVETEHRD